MRKKILGLAPFALAAFSLPAYGGKPANIVFICLDDAGYGDFSYNGAYGYLTPNIDRLASEGLRMTHYLAPQPVSGASRAGMMTGCYPNRFGYRGAPGPGSKIVFPERETTIGEMLQSVGYHTGIVGKWHLGDTPERLPLRNGFDEFYGLPYSNDMSPKVYPTKDFPPLPLYRGEEVEEYEPDMNTLTSRYTGYALDFIKRNRHSPFFLYFAHSMPHIPLGVSDRFRGKSAQGLYGDVMMEIDWSVGEILSALRKYGLDERTLVIVTSDNGPWLNYGNHAGSAGGLREGKSTIFEGGQRTPCIMYWKGRITAGSTCNALVSGLDFFPTFAELAGARLPSTGVDGVSIIPLIDAVPGAAPRQHFAYYFRGNELEAVTDGNFKLVFPHRTRTYVFNRPGNDGEAGKVKYIMFDHEALFDLRNDPGERHEVQDLYPEAVERLRAIAETYRSDLGDDITGREGSGRRLN